MFDGRINFYAGEKKYIDIDVVPKNRNDTVVVSSATYQLLNGETAVEAGGCEIDGAHLKILLGIDDEGAYTLKVTVGIGAEIFIQKATVVVEG